MSRAWKAGERHVARAIGGKRYPANQGGKVDCESETVVAQVKVVKVMPWAQVVRLYEELAPIAGQRAKVPAICIKLSAGRGKETPWLAVVSLEALPGLASAVWRMGGMGSVSKDDCGGSPTT